jgi:anti-sigma regulatory factor (Ser/Thr protein kinase)
MSTPSSDSATYVGLARRSQALVDRLIGHLDRLERGEEDPDRLAELFQLDHLATRMRRNDDNLLVLAGAESTRRPRGQAALIDVLRAAQSEVEQYTRIELGEVDRDVAVAGPAVNDLAHLIAELFDNATAFSPSGSSVLVETRRDGDDVLLSVTDAGGLKPHELLDLNERLADPPAPGVDAIGLSLVALLAGKHAVTVSLSPVGGDGEGGADGTVAEVRLPAAVLAPATERRPEPVLRASAPRSAPSKPVEEPLADRVRGVVAKMQNSTIDELTVEADGGIALRAGSAMIYVRVDGSSPMVNVVSPILTEVPPGDELYAKLSEMTHRMPIGRVYWAEQTVWASVPVFGRDFQPSHLRLAVQVMTGLAEELDNHLQGSFGGKKFSDRTV